MTYRELTVTSSRTLLVFFRRLDRIVATSVEPGSNRTLSLVSKCTIAKRLKRQIYNAQVSTFATTCLFYLVPLRFVNSWVITYTLNLKWILHTFITYFLIDEIIMQYVQLPAVQVHGSWEFSTRKGMHSLSESMIIDLFPDLSICYDFAIQKSLKCSLLSISNWFKYSLN